MGPGNRCGDAAGGPDANLAGALHPDVPALVIMLLALAYLEEEGFALLLALFAALCSLAMTGVTVWGAVETINRIDPATH